LRFARGAKTIAVVRHFAINLVDPAIYKKGIELRRSIAGSDANDLAHLLGATRR
jgi:hypothetical protein